MEIFNLLIIHPILNVLVAIYQLLFSLNIPYALGFSIILLTVVIRFVLYPLTTSQLKASKKMQDIAPHITNLRSKHKGDNKRIQQETMKLYKQHGVNPAAGCLPTLLQLPIIWGLYSVLDRVVKHKTPEDLLEYVNSIVLPKLQLERAWETTFFGLPLGESPQQLLSTMGPIVLLVPILTAVFQYFQTKMLFPPLAPGAKKGDDFASVFQSQSTYIFPLMIGFFSFTLPTGLSLYWNAFTIFGIIQQYRITGLGGLEPLWQKVKTR